MVIRAHAFLAAFAITVSAALLNVSRADAPPGHDKAYWLDLKAKSYKLPQGESALPLALETAALLGSTDPVLRDGVAYEGLVAWVYQDERLDAAELNVLLTTLAANAKRGLGEEIGDGLFLRSFSILALSVLAAEDLKKPFLDEPQFESLVALAVDELVRERDLRGYVPGKGWGHATAHCADLLKFLSRGHLLRAQQQARIVAAIAGRLRSAGQVFVWGEDARLAAALTAVAKRADADPAPFNEWFKQLREEHAAVWSGPFDPARYVPVRTQLNTLSAFAADLDVDTGPAGTIRTAVHLLRAVAQ
jgi:hypothetical protein